MKLEELIEYIDKEKEIRGLFEDLSEIPKNYSFAKIEIGYPDIYERLVEFASFADVDIKEARKLIIELMEFFSSEEWSLYSKISSKEDFVPLGRFIITAKRLEQRSTMFRLGSLTF